MFSFSKKALSAYLIALLVLLPTLSRPHEARAQSSGGNGAIIEAACAIGGYITGLFSEVIGGAKEVVKDEITDVVGLTLSGAVPTYEKNTAVLGPLAVTAGQQTAESCSTILGSVLASLTEILKKKLLDMMVDQIIAWIQGGDTPQFIDDWAGFLRDVADQAGGQLIEDLGLGFLCDPFDGFQIQLALVRPPTFAERAECTITDIVENIEDFYSDFENGSWIAYAYTWAPQNNYFGSLLLAIAELDNREAEAQQAAQNEGLASGGFLSTRKCDEAQGPLPAGAPPDYFGPDIDRDGIYGDDRNTCIITTPGQTIGALTSKAVGADIDWLINANDLAEYVSAIADALINRLIIEGVDGLKGVSTNKKPPGGIFSKDTFKACAGLSSPEYETCLNYAAESEDAAKNPFLAAQDDAAATIDQSLVPRAATQTLFTSSVNELAAYATSLDAFAGAFAGLSCPSLPTYTAAIAAEINWTSGLGNAITESFTSNQGNIDELVALKKDVYDLKKNKWTELINLMNEAKKTGVLNASAAVTLQTNAQADNDAVKAHVLQSQTTFNQNLALCKLGI